MKKPLHVLKLFFFSVAMLLVAPPGFTQVLTSSHALSMNRSMPAGNMSTESGTDRGRLLTDVLMDIEGSYDVNFHYNHTLISGKHVGDSPSFNRHSDKLENVLQTILWPLDLTFQKVGRKIYLIKKSEAEQAQSMNVPPSFQTPVPSDQAIQPIDFTVKGRVQAEDGTTIPGVNVILKGTTIGTVTDADGNFILTLPSSEGTLLFSYIGFIAQEVEIAGRASINITLSEDTRTLDEVVVVGYGVQKKVNLTGSVVNIDAEAIANRPVSNVSSALSGLSAGVFVRQTSGRPGSDSGTIRIRGTGTLNSNEALVIIDGVQGSIDAVNPNDIESISVLKDAASASIYGSLAANGVILITTKKGTKGKTTVNYSGILSQTEASNLPGFVSDYVRHMNLVNEGHRNLGQSNAYSQGTIDAWTNAKLNPNGTTPLGIPNYVAYPNTNWADIIFNSGTLQSHNISVNGGGENVSFLLSAGYLDNPAIIENTGSKRYQFRANVQAKVADFLTIGTRTFGSTETFGLGNAESVFDLIFGVVPGQYPYYDGKYGYPQAPEETLSNNPLFVVRSLGGNDQLTRFNTTLFAHLDLIKGLKLETNINYQVQFGERNTHSVQNERWNFLTNQLVQPKSAPENLSTQYALNKNYRLILESILRYNTRIGEKHDIMALAGYNQNYFNAYNFNATGRGLIDAEITTLGSATTAYAIGGDENDYAIRSWFGRLNYAFDERYLLEGVLRYDGSSRFAPESRWGVFPAFSAGWRISEEYFMEGVNKYVSNLKLRASYGLTGNNASGNYDYQATYNPQIYSFNNTPASALAQNKIANRALQWETTRITNIGLDGALLNGAVDFELDWYNKETEGILFTPDIPLVVGTASAPTRNIAAVLNRGIEVMLGYQGKASEFKYSVGANFAYNYNVVTNYKGQLQEGYVTDESGETVYASNLGEVSTGGNTRILEGHQINEYYLYPVHKGDGTYNNADGSVNIHGGPVDGMIRTPEDLAWVNAMIAAGYQFLPGNTVGKGNIYYGDLIYADINGDGTYGNTFDRQFMDLSANPKFNFGLQARLGWKGVDLFMLWSGSAGMKYFWHQRGFNTSLVMLGDAVPRLVADDHYYYNDADPADPDNNINGKYPRLKNAVDAQNELPSDYYFYNASYVKLRSLQVGYTLPKGIAQKAFASRARIFVSGENLLTITKYPGLDPEIGPNVNYPTMRQYSAGINVTF